MPEGPEIYSNAIEVYNYLYNSTLHKIKILSGKYKKHKFTGYQYLNKILPSNILSISTYGKLIIIQLENNFYILISFGMTGYLTHDSIANNRVEFILDHNSLYFNDQRNFGHIYIYDSESLNNKLKKFGPDILNDKTDIKLFKSQFNLFLDRYPNQEIGLLLINQKFIAGIGNYIRADILWFSRISPHRKLKDLSNYDINKLFYFCYNVPRYYASVQISIPEKLYKGLKKTNLKYKLKYTPNLFNRYFMIYGEDNDIFDNPIIKEKFYGRSIHWVKKLQV